MDPLAHLLATVHIGMSPNMIHVGGLKITWHSFFMAVGTLIAVYLSIRWGRDAGLAEDVMPNVAIWAVIGGLIGARVVNVIDDWAFYKNNIRQIFEIWNGGIGVYGAFIGGLIAGLIVATIEKYPRTLLMDLIAPTMILAQAIGRLGDIINGEHFAKATSLPWGVVYTSPDSPGYDYSNANGPWHPAVAYELFADLAIFGILMALRKRLEPRGVIFALMAFLYSGIRLGFSFLRLDSISDIFGMNQQQFISLVILILSAAWLVYLRPHLGDGSKPARPKVETAPAGPGN
ncbi:MAG: prolipoprotein diacylglyceryl transferase [Chloroflexi bacterium]|nr:prolipoprotein diacylglyceryl transferase [Chloroflexota bacterium]